MASQKEMLQRKIDVLLEWEVYWGVSRVRDLSAILKFNFAPVFPSTISRLISSKNSAYQAWPGRFRYCLTSKTNVF
jgi:hypothetical protein